jgi:hypothetical protein
LIRFLLSLVVALAVSSGAGATDQPGAPFIAFSAEVGGNTDVYVARIDGTDRQRLTTSPGAEFDPSSASSPSMAAGRATSPNGPETSGRPPGRRMDAGLRSSRTTPTSAASG